MKKVFLSLFSAFLALTMVLPLAAPVMADSEQKAKVQMTPMPTLMLRNPGVADVSQSVNITVFGNHNHKPVESAAVYALKTSELAITDNQSDSVLAANYAAIASENGTLLGYTDKNGSISHQFTTDGKYVLVAVKRGFAAGFSRITITLSANQGLDVKAPRTAKVGETITITVSERFSGQPVKGAAVYARKIKELSLPQVIRQNNTVQAKGIARIIHPLWSVLQKIFRPNAIVTTSDNETVQLSAEAVETAAPEETLLQYAADIKETGIVIDNNTDDEGEVNYAFAQPGMYVLIATKDDYAPGFARITVNPGNQKKLGIKAPTKADVGKPVTITVIERNIGDPVGRAAVYAVKIDNTAGYPLPLESATSADAFSTAEVEKYATVAREKGAFIGNTNDSGKVTHTFNETGQYILVTTKDDYVPGFARLAITLIQQGALYIKVPGSGTICQPVSIKVFDRFTGQPVSNAGIYGMRVAVSAKESADGTSTAPMAIESEPTDAVAAEKYAVAVKEKGAPLGYTDGDGELVYSFTETGLYMLVAIKDSYSPGFARITITLAAPRALFIKAPGEANTGQKIPIAVYTRQGYQPAEKAAVYAIKWNVLPAPTPVEDGTATQILKPQPPYATEAEKYAALARDEGIFIDYTDDNGQVFHAFDKAGRYTLVAIKDGYTPAFTTINIRPYRMMNPKKLEKAKPTILQSTSGSSNSKRFE